LKLVLVMLLLLSGLSPILAQNAVYDGLRDGRQMAVELIVRDTTFVSMNPKWFTGDFSRPCVYGGTLRYSDNKDTLYLTSVYTNAMREGIDTPAYNADYAKLWHDGKDLVGWHYDSGNVEFRYVYLRDTTGLPIPDSPPRFPTSLTPLGHSVPYRGTVLSIGEPAQNGESYPQVINIRHFVSVSRKN